MQRVATTSCSFGKHVITCRVIITAIYPPTTTLIPFITNATLPIGTLLTYHYRIIQGSNVSLLTSINQLPTNLPRYNYNDGLNHGRPSFLFTSKSKISY